MQRHCSLTLTLTWESWCAPPCIVARILEHNRSYSSADRILVQGMSHRTKALASTRSQLVHESCWNWEIYV